MKNTTKTQNLIPVSLPLFVSYCVGDMQKNGRGLFIGDTIKTAVSAKTLFPDLPMLHHPDGVRRIAEKLTAPGMPELAPVSSEDALRFARLAQDHGMTTDEAVCAAIMWRASHHPDGMKTLRQRNPAHA